MDELIKYAVGFGVLWVVVTILAFLWVKARLTKSIEHEYAQKLEKYSTNLRHQSELALKEFEAKANERSIKLTGIFERQADTVNEMYGKLVVVVNVVENYINSKVDSAESNREITKAVENAIRDLLVLYQKKKILLLPKTSEMMATLQTNIMALSMTKSFRDLYAATKEFHILNPDTAKPALHETLGAAIDSQDDQIKEFRVAIYKMLEVLESDFRQLLGVTSTN
jgi:hypothetical protein